MAVNLIIRKQFISAHHGRVLKILPCVGSIFHENFILSGVRGNIYENIRPTHRKITNKPWDDRNYIDSNRKMYKNI